MHISEFEFKNAVKILAFNCCRSSVISNMWRGFRMQTAQLRKI